MSFEYSGKVVPSLEVRQHAAKDIIKERLELSQRIQSRLVDMSLIFGAVGGYSATEGTSGNSIIASLSASTILSLAFTSAIERHNARRSARNAASMTTETTAPYGNTNDPGKTIEEYVDDIVETNFVNPDNDSLTLTKEGKELLGRCGAVAISATGGFMITSSLNSEGMSPGQMAAVSIIVGGMGIASYLSRRKDAATCNQHIAEISDQL